MKRFVLSLLVGIVGFIGFSSASDITGTLTCAGDFAICTPVITECGNGTKIGFKINSVPGDGYYIYINDDSYEVTSDDYTYLDIDECSFSLMTNPPLSINYIIPIEGDDNIGGDDNTGGDDNIGGSIVSGGFGTFTPLLTGITTLLGEFIPYVIYLGLGVLICILGFIGVKWLMSWVSKRVTKTFK